MTPASVKGWLDQYDPQNDGAALKSVELMHGLLDHSSNPFSRHQYTPGHITATACVKHPTENLFLLIHHKRLQRWLMPGGHVETGDPDVSDSAAREAVEETGIQLVQARPMLVSVDVHAIPPKKEEPLHLHHDLTFAFRAVSADVAISEETEGVIWASVKEFSRYQLAGNLQRAVLRSLAS